MSAYNASFFGAQLLSLIVGHTVSVPAGAGVGFGVFVVGTAASLFIARTPDVQPNARLFKKGRLQSIIYYLAFYSVSSQNLSILAERGILTVKNRGTNSAMI
jgi:solute carrier family 6 GABA transporter-like protein 1